MADLSSDMRQFIAILLRYHVEFLICGGHAVAFYGYPRMTMDMDVLIRPNEHNAARLKSALGEFGFAQAGIPWEAFETEGAAVSLGVQPNQIDLLTSVSGQSTDEVFANAKPGHIASYDVLFISREDLLRAKREANRPKDQVDIDELNKLQNDDQSSPKGIDCPVPMFNIPLIKPYLPPGTKEKVCAVLDSGYLTEGPVTRDFEHAVADYIGVSHAIAVTSCTTGLELALRAAGIGPGDEVIVPDYTHPATAAVVAIVGATIVLVDVDPETMLIDYDAAEAAITSRTRALLPVSLFGNPLDYDRLDTMKADNDLVVIEDAACALGAEYRGNKVGGQADVAVFSCHPRKFITTGEGGGVATNNDELAEWMRSYKNFGIAQANSRAETRFERFGTNYKMSDILAAVGISQMEHIDEMLVRRRELALNYVKLLRRHEQIRLPVTTHGGIHSYQTFCVLIENRDHVLTELRSQGIEVQIGTYALHERPAYREGPQCRHAGTLSGSKSAFERCLALPLSHTLTSAEQAEVVSGLEELAGFA